jgi:hypothetical protein
MTTPDPTEWLWKKLDKWEVADILFDPHPAIEQLKALRSHLAMWWNELPQDTRDALKHNDAGMVPGLYREDVAALGPMGEVDSHGQDRRQPFKLPVVVLAYLDVIDNG